jgi:hypothetical protein
MDPFLTRRHPRRRLRRDEDQQDATPSASAFFLSTIGAGEIL